MVGEVVTVGKGVASTFVTVGVDAGPAFVTVCTDIAGAMVIEVAVVGLSDVP